MDKRDAAILLAALGLVMVMALVIKPQLTGKGPDLQLPFQKTLTPTPAETRPTLQATRTPLSTAPTTPAPPPTWGGQSQSLGFVSTGSPPTTPTFTVLPDESPEKTVLLDYVTISSEGGGITQSFTMPFPYWELHYTVDPWDTTFVGETGSKEAGQAEFFGVEVFPSFSIELRNARDNSLVRKIEPRGGLDAKLWEKGEEYDPRPWVEKFYERNGTQEYYLAIKTHMIKSYRIDVMVPDRYLGKY